MNGPMLFNDTSAQFRSFSVPSAVVRTEEKEKNWKIISQQRQGTNAAWISVLFTYLSCQTGRCVKIKHCFIICGEIFEDTPPIDSQ